MTKLGLNRVMLIGEVERAAYKVGASGKARLWFKLHSRSNDPGDDDADRVRDTWNSVVIFGARATGLRAYIVPGARVAIEGRLVTSRWDQGGAKKERIEVHAVSVVLLASSPPSQAA